MAKDTLKKVRDDVLTSALAGFLVLAPPYLLMIVLYILGAVLHWKFGASPWSLAGMNLMTMGLTAAAFLLSRSRSGPGRVLTTISPLCAGLWLMAASAVGVTDQAILWLWLVAGSTLAVGWNLRTGLHIKNAGQGDDAQRDPLAALFASKRERAGMGKAKLRMIEDSGNKIKARLELEPGEQTVDDAKSKRSRMESAMGTPPGAMIITENEDSAAMADVVFINPRALRYPVMWPGPYLPGRSIAYELRTGIWADGDDILHRITGHHLQVMGMSGSGKSEGMMWNYMAEIISRYDAVVFGMDVTKGSQFFNPFAGAIHYETKIERVIHLINVLSPKVKERTEFLTAKGLTKWEEGCGLDYWIIWLEECPDIWDGLPSKVEEKLLSMIKAIRSAGGTMVLSLQRSDFSQMPTIARGQLASATFGCANSKDAAFGLSEAQIDGGADPAQWGTRYPGMLYLDVPGLDAERIVMPARTFSWNSDTAALREHVETYGTPLAQRQLDPFTRAVLAEMAAYGTSQDGQGGAAYEGEMSDQDMDPMDRAESEMELDDMPDDGESYTVRHDDLDPDPDVTDAVDETTEIKADQELEEGFSFVKLPDPRPYAEVEQAIRQRISGWPGGKRFRLAELSELWAGKVSRQFVGKVLGKLADEDLIIHDDEDARFWITAQRDQAVA